MKSVRRIIYVSFVLLLSTTVAETQAAPSVYPTQNALDIPVNTNIIVTFSAPVGDPTIFSESSVVVYGRNSGPMSGLISFDNTLSILTFSPTKSFSAGEIVTVVLTNTVLPALNGFAWTFQIMSRDLDVLNDYQTEREYTVGDQPQAVIASDLNGDGFLDLATANWLTSGTISILINKRDGTFDTSNDYFTMSDRPQNLFAADFDSDGDMDLAVVNHGGSNRTVSVMLNDGIGRFSLGVTLDDGESTPTPHSVFGSDTDNDGDIDIMYTRRFGDYITIFTNSGSNIYSSFIMMPAGGATNSIFSSDFDNDGHFDFCVQHSLSNSINVFINHRGIDFTNNGSVQVGSEPVNIVSSDINSDGYMDIVTTNSLADSISVLYNDGFGNFVSRTDFSTGRVGGNPYAVNVCDIDGDGDNDILASNRNSGSFAILLNDGLGSYTFAREISIRGSFPLSIYCADLNNDGYLDITVAGSLTANISVFLSGDLVCGDVNSNGEVTHDDITYLVEFYFMFGPPPKVIESADLNADGIFDLADIVYLAQFLNNNGPAPCATSEPPPSYDPKKKPEGHQTGPTGY